MQPPRFTIGIEEEYLLVDGRTGDLRQASSPVVDGASDDLGEQIQPELLQSQVEVATPVCASLHEARAEIVRLRSAAADAARAEGCRLTAAAAHPTARWESQRVTEKDRYRSLADGMGQVANETLICGMHVHVGVADREDRVRVLDELRPWLPVLLALSASSPYWEGRDTGLDSFRTPIFRRWPQTGMPQPFADWAELEALVAALAAAGAITDGTNLYWDLRPSWRFDTVEVRIADVCPAVDEALAIAGLVRALVWTVLSGPGPTAGPRSRSGGRSGAGRQAGPRSRSGGRSGAGRQAGPGPVSGAARPRTEVLEAAVRRAARFGLGGDLVHPVDGSLAPAGAVVDALVDHCAAGLDSLGDADLVAAGIDRIRRDGNSATRQRRAFARRQRWADVVDALADETLAGG